MFISRVVARAAVFRDQHGERFTPALHLRQILPGEPVAVGHLHATWPATAVERPSSGMKIWSPSFAKKADGMGSAAIVQRFADHRRALAAGVEVPRSGNLPSSK